MIDSKKIISYIKKHINPYGKPFEGTLFEFGCKVIDYIEAMEKQPKTDWIPCEERLPSEEGFYVVTIEDYFKPVISNFSVKNQKWYWRDRVTETKNVTAWQPLPQPYKKEGAS